MDGACASVPVPTCALSLEMRCGVGVAQAGLGCGERTLRNSAKPGRVVLAVGCMKRPVNFSAEA